MDNPFNETKKLELPKLNEPSEEVVEVKQDVVLKGKPKVDRYAHMLPSLRHSEKARLLEQANGVEKDIPADSPYWEL